MSLAGPTRKQRRNHLVPTASVSKSRQVITISDSEEEQRKAKQAVYKDKGKKSAPILIDSSGSETDKRSRKKLKTGKRILIDLCTPERELPPPVMPSTASTSKKPIIKSRTAGNDVTTERLHTPNAHTGIFLPGVTVMAEEGQLNKSTLKRATSRSKTPTPSVKSTLTPQNHVNRQSLGSHSRNTRSKSKSQTPKPASLKNLQRSSSLSPLRKISSPARSTHAISDRVSDSEEDKSLPFDRTPTKTLLRSPTFNLKSSELRLSKSRSFSVEIERDPSLPPPSSKKARSASSTHHKRASIASSKAQDKALDQGRAKSPTLKPLRTPCEPTNHKKRKSEEMESDTDSDNKSTFKLLAAKPVANVKVNRLPGESLLEWRKRLVAAQREMHGETARDLDSEPERERLRQALSESESDLDDYEKAEAAGVAAAKEANATRPKRNIRQAVDKQDYQKSYAASATQGPAAKTQQDKTVLDMFETGDFGGGGKFSLEGLRKAAKEKKKKGWITTGEAEAILRNASEEEQDDTEMKFSKSELEQMRTKRIAMGGKAADNALLAVFDDALDNSEAIKEERHGRRIWASSKEKDASPVSNLEALIKEKRSVATIITALGLESASSKRLAYRSIIGRMSDEQKIDLICWLFVKLSISLSSASAEYALAVFASAIKTLGGTNPSWPLSADLIRLSLTSFGADLSSASKKGKEKEGSSSRNVAPIDNALSDSSRKTGVLVLLRMLDLLSECPRWSDDSKQIIDIILMLLQLGSDPESSSILAQILNTLGNLFRCDCMQRPTMTANVLKKVYGMFRYVSKQHQSHLVSCLPHATEQDMLLRRWLALALLTNIDDDALPDSIDRSPPMQSLLELVTSLGTGPFNFSEETDDLVLYHSILLLQYCFCDLWSVLTGTDQQEKDDIALFSKSLGSIDGRFNLTIKGDPLRHKAKNSLTQLSHALQYQMQAASNSKSKRLSQPPRQTRLSFGPAIATAV